MTDQGACTFVPGLFKQKEMGSEYPQAKELLYDFYCKSSIFQSLKNNPPNWQIEIVFTYNFLTV